MRYVDDFALFANDIETLEYLKARVSAFLYGRRLLLHADKTRMLSTVDAATFLGLVLKPSGERRLPEENVRRFRNKLRGLRDRWRAGTVEESEVRQTTAAWVAHACHADTWRLRHAIFRGGWFDPLNLPSRGPGRLH